MKFYKNIAFFCAILLGISLVFSCTGGEVTDISVEEKNILVPPDTTNQVLAATVDTSQIIDTTNIPQKIAKPTRKPAQMKFETTTFNYDTIAQGKVVEYEFKFKNIGELPLSIKDVKGSCGCTIGSYPFLDIAPNEQNSIKARFDSKGKKGTQSTTITVYSNGEPKEVVLSLKGFVKE